MRVARLLVVLVSSFTQCGDPASVANVTGAHHREGQGIDERQRGICIAEGLDSERHGKFDPLSPSNVLDIFFSALYEND